MTPKNPSDAGDDDSLGVLDESASLDTTGIGLLSETAQVTVALPVDEDDDLADDEVIDGEVVSAEASALDSSPAREAQVGRPADVAPASTANGKKPAAVKVPAAKKPTTVPAVTSPAAPSGERTIAAAPAGTASAATGETGTAPAVVVAQRAKAQNVSTPRNEEASESDRRPARPELELTSKRIGEQQGQAARESADLLTADRLLDPHHVTRPEPEGAWSHLLYTLSGRRINLGDGRRARERKELSARIAAPLPGGARFVPVLSRKGGVGKTTVTALLGMALADARDDRVIAVDANPDRGTLADRIARGHGKSVRDLARAHDEIRGYHDVSAIVARDATRLDVLASDADPGVAEAFGDTAYRDVAGVAAHYYSLVLTDTGTGIVHSVMSATLDLADQLVIVAGLSVDEARLASETLTWLEANGRADLARNAIVVLNQSAPGSPLVRLNELETHFRTRARHVVRMPYDSHIAAGGPIAFASLQPETRQASRELAALLVEGLRAGAA